jgi:hypothetical protein
MANRLFQEFAVGIPPVRLQKILGAFTEDIANASENFSQLNNRRESNTGNARG